MASARRTAASRTDSRRVVSPEEGCWGRLDIGGGWWWKEDGGGRREKEDDTNALSFNYDGGVEKR